MSYTVFNHEHVNRLKEPMFLGAGGNVLRFDVQKYSVFERLTDKQLSFFWRPEEVNLTKDAIDFKKLSTHEQHIFTSNLRLQTLADSMAGRAISTALVAATSLPELETWYELVAGWEAAIHAKSYSHIIRNIYNSPDEIFDGILDIPEVVARASQMGNQFDEAIAYYTNFQVGTEGFTKKGLLRHIYLSLVSLYILEGIRFFASFACSFAFAERELMEGNAKIIKLICRDEMLHALGGQNVLNLAHSDNESELQEVALECHGEAITLFTQAAEEEKTWAEFLFKDGSMVGLNASMLSHYIEFITNQRMEAVGLGTIFKERTNPLPWMDTWLDSDSVQVAPQETEISSYLVGAIDTTMAVDEFEGFEL